jgi:site-specific DNA-methyltransferase (adenine-specific)
MGVIDPSLIDRNVNCDCLAGMRTLPDDCIHLTVTSPPYDGLRSFGGHALDFETFEGVADELHRITRPGGVVVWVVADAIEDGSETCTSARQKVHFRKIGFRVHHTMVMDKAGSRWPWKVRYGHSLEYAFILSKGRPRTINLLRDKPNRRVGRVREFNRRETDGQLRQAGKARPIAAQGHRRAIWCYATGWGLTTRDRHAYEHPALMPEKMALDHIISWSQPGDLVFDPFCGAGTTTKMALLNHRRYLGFEVNPQYHEIALRRMQDAREEYRRRLDGWLIGA